MGDCIEHEGYKNKGGYARIYLGRKGGKMILKLAHRVAWEKSRGPIPDGMLVCHSCDNRSCVNVEHLFLGTHLDNMADMRGKGRSPASIGSRNGKAKLTEETAVYAMARLLTGRETHKEIADRFGVSRRAITNLWNGHCWAHLFQNGGVS